jgi:outer membrane protein assembly factor BamA
MRPIPSAPDAGRGAARAMRRAAAGRRACLVRALIRIGIAFAAAVLITGVAGAAVARLELRPQLPAYREAEALFAEALRAPGDSARTQAALGRLILGLQDRGYLDARAHATWQDAPSRLVVDISTGRCYRIASVVFETPSPDDSSRFAEALGLTPGLPASPAALASRITRAVESLADDGHPYAVLGVRGWQTDSTGVHVRLAGTLGPSVQITGVRIDGLQVTRRDLALRAMGRLTGQPYRRVAAEDARDRLAALGLFSSVAFQGLEGEGDWSRAHLVYRVTEPHYNEFEGALGMQGATGTVGLVHLELQNLLGTGRGMGLAWESRGTGVTLFNAHASEPQLFGQPLRIEGHVDQEVQDTAYVSTRWGLMGSFALSGRERIEAGYEVERVVSEHQLVEEADLNTTSFALERSSLDAAPLARRGTLVRLTGAQVFKVEHLRPLGENTARASVAELRLNWRQPVTRATGIALELLSAGRFSSQRVLPIYERYPLGGAATLRGYDEQQFRVDRFALTRLEWGRTLGAQWAYLFWDHAWMATQAALPQGGDELQRLSRHGIGFGLRLPAAGGVVGLDYGLEPGRRPSEGKIHLKLVSQF